MSTTTDARNRAANSFFASWIYCDTCGDVLESECPHWDYETAQEASK